MMKLFKEILIAPPGIFRFRGTPFPLKNTWGKSPPSNTPLLLGHLNLNLVHFISQEMKDKNHLKRGISRQPLYM